MLFLHYINIIIAPEIRFGEVSIKGTRIAMADMLKGLDSGKTDPEILDDYTLLKKAHIICIK